MKAPEFLLLCGIIVTLAILLVFIFRCQPNHHLYYVVSDDSPKYGIGSDLTLSESWQKFRIVDNQLMNPTTKKILGAIVTEPEKISWVDPGSLYGSFSTIEPDYKGILQFTASQNVYQDPILISDGTSLNVGSLAQTYPNKTWRIVPVSCKC